MKKQIEAYEGTVILDTDAWKGDTVSIDKDNLIEIFYSLENKKVRVTIEVLKD